MALLNTFMKLPPTLCSIRETYINHGQELFSQQEEILYKMANFDGNLPSIKFENENGEDIIQVIDASFNFCRL